MLVLRSGPDDPALEAHTAYDQFGTRREGGETVANGLVYLYNNSKQPIVLEAARNLATGDIPDDFRFLVHARSAGDEFPGGIELQCPPSFFKKATMRPLNGFVLQPRSSESGKLGAVLITCFTVPPSPSRLHITKTRISYRQDGDPRSLTFTNDFAVCGAPKGRCDAGTGATNSF